MSIINSIARGGPKRALLDGSIYKVACAECMKMHVEEEIQSLESFNLDGDMALKSSCWSPCNFIGAVWAILPHIQAV